MPRPTTADDLLALAVRHVNAGQAERAALLCEHALATQPAHAGVLQLLAWLKLERGDAVEASTLTERSLALRPAHAPTAHVAADAWFQRSMRHQDEREFEAAADALHAALRHAPERAEAEVNLGVVLQELGRIDEAMQAYGRAYRLRDDSFGRIAHALAALPSGRLWLWLDDLRTELRAA